MGRGRARCRARCRRRGRARASAAAPHARKSSACLGASQATARAPPSSSSGCICSVSAARAREIGRRAWLASRPVSPWSLRVHASPRDRTATFCIASTRKPTRRFAYRRLPAPGRGGVPSPACDFAPAAPPSPGSRTASVCSPARPCCRMPAPGLPVLGGQERRRRRWRDMSRAPHTAHGWSCCWRGGARQGGSWRVDRGVTWPGPG